jgi:hypothetical protein
MEMENKIINIDEYKRDRFVYSMQGNPRQATLCYIAGIIDGEGWIGIHKAKPYAKNKDKNYVYSARIGVGMVTKEILVLLQECFGGNMHEECVPGRRSIWRWQVTGRMMIYKILEELTPYLIVKRKQAEVVMAFCKDWHTPYSKQRGLTSQELLRREEAYLLMRKLNSVGAAATTKRVNTREGEAIV